MDRVEFQSLLTHMEWADAHPWRAFSLTRSWFVLKRARGMSCAFRKFDRSPMTQLCSVV